MKSKPLSRLGLFIVPIICLAGCLIVAAPASAELLAYEGFDYSPAFLVNFNAAGTQVAPFHNGGTGWSGPWDNAQGLPPVGVLNDGSAIQASGLQYTDTMGNVLVTAGGKLLNSGGGDNGGGPGTLTSQPGRALTNRRTSSPEGATVSTWISFLSQRIGDVNADGGQFDGTYRRGANLALFDLEGPAAQAEKLNIGESSNQQYPLGGVPPTSYEDRIQTRVPGIPATVLAPQPYPQNPEGSATSNVNGARVQDGFAAAKFKDLTLTVIRIDHVTGDTNAATTGGTFGGNDNMYVWTNPILSSTPSDISAEIKYISADVVAIANALATPVAPYNGDPTTTGSGSGGEINFDRLRLFAGNIAGTTPFAQWDFDELRIGTTFADVAPIDGPTGTIGDYNGDGNVDAADYTVWRNNVGNAGTTLLNRDPGNGGLVGDDDYDSWKSNFGAGGGGSVSGPGVPEPSSFVMGLLCLVGLSAVRRRMS
jgi:hypothetical protein